MDIEYTHWDQAEVIFQKIKGEIVNVYKDTYEMETMITAPSVSMSWTQEIVDALDAGRTFIEVRAYATKSGNPETISFQQYL